MKLARAAAVALGLTWLGLVGVGLLWWGLVFASLFFLSIALGVAFPRLGIHAAIVCHVKTNSHCVALTFDDGPHPLHTRTVLNILDAYGAKATFFLIGAKAAAHPDLVREVIARGHQVENHSWAHERWFPLKAAEKLSSDLTRTSQTLEAITGKPPKWLRPPFGVVSPLIAEGASRAGLCLCGWSASARDGTKLRKAQDALQSLSKGLKPGAILALHDSAERGDRAPATVEILESLLLEMKKKGFSSVTLNNLIVSS